MFKTAFLLVWRQKAEIFINSAFVVLAWLFVGLVLGKDMLMSKSLSSLLDSFFWVIFLFSITLSSTRFFREDMEDGTVSLLKTEPDVIDVFIFSRLIVLGGVNIFNALLSLGALALMAGFFSVSIALKLFLMLPGIVGIFLFVQMICLSHKNASQLLPLLIWPLITPFFIFATATGSNSLPYWILGALSAFLGPLCFWGMRFCFRFL